MIIINYAYYIVVLLLLTGIIILIVDVKNYKNTKMDKEKKTAHFTGWFNICLGVLVFIGFWSYEKWFW